MRRRLLPISCSRVVLVLAAMLLAGCMPFPHFSQATPKIEGRVLNLGKPAQAKIYLHEQLYPADAQCRRSTIAATTDDEGRFHFRGRKDFHFFLSVGDPISTWSLCIDAAGQPIAGWRAFHMGDAEPAASFDCELSDVPVRQPGGSGVCKRRP